MTTYPDIYQPREGITLYRGDCLDILPTLTGIDAVITDPPYGIGWDTDYTRFTTGFNVPRTNHKPIHADEAKFDPRPFLLGVPSVMFGANFYADALPVGTWLVWDKRLDESADKMFGSCFELIWSRASHKQDILRHKWAGIFGTEHEPVRGRVHPNQKPVQLYTDLLSRYGGAIVIDPYAGSGNTIIAAENLSRQCLAVEISPGYVAVALQRYCDAFGITPELIA